jgi:DNA-binding GntR family transcriptional regulator
MSSLAARASPARAAIELIRSTSLSGLVRQEIMHMILSGELDAGEKIGEAAIAARLGVGRSNVREAIRALAETGLVATEKNRGAFVRAISDAEARELYEVRAGLDDLAARLLAQTVGEDAIAELTRRVDELDRLSADVDQFARYYERNLAFHDRIVELAGNGTLLRLYRGVIDQMHLLRRRGLLRGGGLQVSNREHRAIVASLAARDPDRAAKACREHTLAGFARMRAVPADGAGHEAAQRRGAR